MDVETINRKEVGRTWFNVYLYWIWLQSSIKLASKADELGYERFWVTEHHNIPLLASASPELLIGQIAASTQRIRVGSGGVMLPNHSPLKVAENFKLLETFYPGRITIRTYGGLDYL